MNHKTHADSHPETHKRPHKTKDSHHQSPKNVSHNHHPQKRAPKVPHRSRALQKSTRHAVSHHQPRKKSHLKLYAWIGVGVLAALGLVVGLWFYHRSEIASKSAALSQNSQNGIKFPVATAEASKNERQILLTGETRAFYSVTVYARVSGYLDKLLVDIGDTVKKGQLLAHVQSPEQQQSYFSARADAINKRRINQRIQILKRQNLVSQQQADQSQSEADIAEANLKTQTVLRDYQNIVAPFDGIISNRFVDPGSLLQNASGSQSASQPLFTLTQADPLRIFIYIDQKDAPYVHVGDPVQILIPDPGAAPLAAKITMLASELDPQTRTLLAEILLTKTDENPLPITAGSFVQVKMQVKTESFPELPSQALVMRGEQAFVGLLQANNTIHYSKIDLAENNGETILVRSGIKNGEKVVLQVGNTVAEGQKIQPVQTKKQAHTQPAAQQKTPDSTAQTNLALPKEKM